MDIEMLLEIIDSLYDGVLLTDKEGKILIYNPAMEELEERKAEDMIGKYTWDAYEYSGKNESEHMQVFQTGVPIINKYKAHAFNNGKPIYKSYSTLPIYKNEEIIGVYSISKNETKLQSLLSETVELKRQFNKGKDKTLEINSNGTRFNFANIIGSSEIMKKIIKEAEAISWLDNSILLVGDTGTGKEVFAQSIHNFGKRASKPFIGINCSAIPENLLESILFGSVKGAYTGALDSRGLFEEAGEGTMFLDELNSMPINMQTKLLRVLQERTVRRVGGKESYPINCRIISAMNEDPYKLIQEEKLRIMDNYNWPGNIRELEHFIENIMVRTGDDERYLREDNIPGYILDLIQEDKENINSNLPVAEDLQGKLNVLERKSIIDILNNNMWNVSKSAKNLGITRQSLIYRMKRLEIERK